MGNACSCFGADESVGRAPGKRTQYSGPGRTLGEAQETIELQGVQNPQHAAPKLSGAPGRKLSSVGEDGSRTAEEQREQRARAAEERMRRDAKRGVRPGSKGMAQTKPARDSGAMPDANLDWRQD